MTCCVTSGLLIIEKNKNKKNLQQCEQKKKWDPIGAEVDQKENWALRQMKKIKNCVPFLLVHLRRLSLVLLKSNIQYMKTLCAPVMKRRLVRGCDPAVALQLGQAPATARADQGGWIVSSFVREHCEPERKPHCVPLLVQLADRISLKIKSQK